jgi:hypothetical protein
LYQPLRGDYWLLVVAQALTRIFPLSRSVRYFLQSSAMLFFAAAGSPPPPEVIAGIILFTLATFPLTLNIVAWTAGWKKLAARFRYDEPLQQLPHGRCEP